jgi:phosphodiesterase/alkaline phosphatase D-like protein
VVAGAPAATTGAASSIGATSVSLAGSVTPNGASTSYAFEYGTSTSFGSLSDVLGAGNSASPQPVAAALTGLTPGRTYYYRLVAVNSAGQTFGAVSSFRTTGGTPLAPAVVTGGSSAVTTSGATVAGTVNPNGQATAFTVEYGTSTSFGSIAPVVQLDNADAVEAVTATLPGRTADTTDYYRIVATNATGTSSGAVSTFDTGPGGAPVAVTGAASAITTTGATLAGTVNAHGAQTAFAFEYGPTNAFGSLSAIDSAGTSNTTQSVSLPLTGLAPGTTYRYRIVATNANGTTTGTVGSFTTAPGA